MTRTKNMEALREVIRQLGLPPSLERQLELYSALQTDSFKLPYRLVKQEDILNLQLHFEKQHEAEYTCSYFDLCLRRKLGLPSEAIEGIDLVQLSSMMKQVDWGKVLVNDGELSADKNLQQIIDALQLLSSKDASRIWSDRLKLLYWADTPMEVFVPNLSVLKSQYEISQRFYCFEGEEMITVHEAYRFLSIKWREKQLNQEKKQKDTETESTGETRSGSERARGQKLLVKKRRQPGTKLKLL